MIPEDFQKYIRSKDFKDLLAKYEKAVAYDLETYFDEDDLLDIAEYYHLKGKVDEVDQVLDYIFLLYPKSVKAYTFKAKQALLLGNVEFAEQIISIIQDDTSFDTIFIRAEVLVSKDKATEAEEILNDYWNALEPEDYDEDYPPQSFLNYRDDDADDEMPLTRSDFALDIAVMYCDHGEWEYAGEWIDRVKDPELKDNGDYYEVKAMLFTEKRMYGEAITMWNKYIDKDAYSARAWLQLSHCQYCHGECNEALQSIEYAETIDPCIPETYIAKGNCLLSLGDHEAALAAYKSVRNNPYAELHARVLISTVYFSLEEYDKAYQQITTAVKDLETGDYPFTNCEAHCEIYRHASFICSAAGKSEEALNYAEHLPLLGITDERYLFVKARIYLEAKEFNKGFEIISGILESNDHDSMIYVQMGCMLVDAGITEYGYKILDTALGNMEKEGAAIEYGYEHLAFAALLSGKYDEFLKALEKSISRNPTDTYCIFSLLFPKYMPLSEYLEYAKTHTIEYPKRKKE